ncbi:MAG TPA: NAD(P)-dependent oxidoreductase [Propionibacteriaceae bacterium]|jgi:3-hydroxyisobutyrate dehydrogenase and related beta-hydroxyacid dehydrogenases
MSRMPSIGVAGTGRMGSAATLRLVNQGFKVTVANRTAAASSDLAVQADCSHAETFAELASSSDVVLVLTAGEDGTRETVLGPHGLLAKPKPGSTILIMSTVTPQVIRELADAAADAGVALADVPISGRPLDLSQGDVTLLAGGSSELLTRVTPVLDALGHTVIVGPTGAAAAMKLGVNAVVFGLVTAVAECLTLASASGVDPEIAYDVLRASAVASNFIDVRRAAFVSDPPPPVQFSMQSTQETLELIVRAAGESGVTLPQTLANLAIAREAASSGLADDDVTRLAQFLSRRSRR